MFPKFSMYSPTLSPCTSPWTHMLWQMLYSFSHIELCQRGGTQNKTYYFGELPLLHFFLSDWPTKLARCKKQIELGRHLI
jgi:hypothetical protein